MKKTILFLTIACITVLFAVSACAPAGTSLAGSSWKLTSYGPTNAQVPAVTGVDTNLTFGTDGKIGGKLGCNSMGGDYTVSGSNITFANVYATEMACADPQMAQEGIAFLVIKDTTTFKNDGNTLTITSADGNYTLTFAVNKTK